MVIDIMERYWLEFDTPRLVKYRKQLVPFAEQFYSDLSTE